MEDWGDNFDDHDYFDHEGQQQRDRAYEHNSGEAGQQPAPPRAGRKLQIVPKADDRAARDAAAAAAFELATSQMPAPGTIKQIESGKLGSK